MGRYVQYGCGLSAPDGWENYDASLTLRFERIPLIGGLYTRNASRFPKNVRFGDIIKGLPVPAASCDGVYCSHVLEHLSQADARVALGRTLTMLKPGRPFRLVVPDLGVLARRYLEDPSPDACSNFMEKSMLGRQPSDRSWRSVGSRVFGRTSHLWMWDAAGMSRELAAAGFMNVRPAKLGDSGEPAFDLVEEPERWVDSVALHCTSPG